MQMRPENREMASLTAFSRTALESDPSGDTTGICHNDMSVVMAIDGLRFLANLQGPWMINDGDLYLNKCITKKDDIMMADETRNHSMKMMPVQVKRSH